MRTFSSSFNSLSLYGNSFHNGPLYDSKVGHLQADIRRLDKAHALNQRHCLRKKKVISPHSPLLTVDKELAKIRGMLFEVSSM